MDTPICDFARRYAASDVLRLHMPGHKGMGPLGPEPLDLTEIPGADDLYDPQGIIARSEENAGQLFGGTTVYSTEGSSLSIRAMLYLAMLYARSQGRKPRIIAGRNAHKAFLSAAALLDLEVQWLWPSSQSSYLSCPVTAEDLEAALAGEPPAAVYITSPDYLGHITPIAPLAEVCHRHNVLLLVDNAHGAYLRFLDPCRHPLALGADLCCDSAHKTLGVLTGGGYLHIAPQAPAFFRRRAKEAMTLFGSTSPSYLILQSLDAANAALAGSYPRRLQEMARETVALRRRLEDHGFACTGQEPLKLTLCPKSYGYTGTELAAALQRRGHIVCEFSDPDFVVLMVSPETGREGLARLESTLLSLPRWTPITTQPPAFRPPRQRMSIRQAAFSLSRTVPTAQSIGHILADAAVGCPPAVPIVACGEEIDADAAAAFAYYGITRCTVVDESL